MSYIISYACCSATGLVRKNHEDNFLVSGKNLPHLNHGTEGIVEGYVRTEEGPLPVLAVFDGMGGEEAGETAAYLASEQMKQFLADAEEEHDGSENDRIRILSDPQTHRFLCELMNQSVLMYAREHRIGIMGTTAAYIAAAGDEVVCVNVGDSRIYHVRGGQMRQVSTDHTAYDFFYRKGALTQFLGLPDDEYLLVPAISKIPCLEGDRYLICSDGVTDMLEDEEILAILLEEEKPASAAGRLLEAVYRNGARDNTTLIVCEFHR